MTAHPRGNTVKVAQLPVGERYHDSANNSYVVMQQHPTSGVTSVMIEHDSSGGGMNAGTISRICDQEQVYPDNWRNVQPDPSADDAK